MRAGLWIIAVLVACSQKKQDASQTAGSGSQAASQPTTPAAAADVIPSTLDLCHGAWCWASPRPQGSDLRTVAARTPDDIWAAGDWGAVVRWDGKAWRAESIGAAKLTRIWPRAEDDVWAIGERGFVARRDAKGWTVLPSGTQEDLTAIDGSGPNDVWIVGKRTTVLRWDGSTLSRYTELPAAQALYSIHVVAPDDIWIGGMELHHWNGKKWSSDDTLGLGFWMDVRGDTDGGVIGVDDLGRILRRDKKRWQIAAASGWVELVEDLDADLVYADGHQYAPQLAGTADERWIVGGSRALRYDGKRWRQVAGLPKMIRASTLVAAGVIVGVGTGGRIVRGNGREFSDEHRGTELRYAAMWCESGPLVLLGYDRYWGQEAKAVTFDGTTISAKVRMNAGNAIAGTAADDLIAVGEKGTIATWNGGTWKRTELGIEPSLRGIARVSARLAWAVGDKGTIARWDGAAWSLVASPTTGNITDVWAASADSAWAIAREGKESIVLRWDGSAWTIAQRRADLELRSLAGIDDAHVWIGAKDKLLAWNGSTWTETASPPLDAMVAVAIGDVWAIGGGAVHHHDGSRWTSDPLGRGVGTICATKRAVWLGGQDGTLLVRRR